MQLTQIYISEDSQPMGELLEFNAKKARAALPKLNYRIYGDSDIKELISSHFDQEILNTYNRLRPFAYKSDLARYCILHEVGGWYLDIGLSASGAQINVPNSISLIAFRDQPYRHTASSFACANGAIYAKAKHSATAKAIELIVENTRNEYYGLTPLCPTGPTLWGRAIAITGIDNSCIFGDFLELTPSYSKKNKAMVLPDGTILAFHKQSGGGDLKALGAKGTNNYNDFWHNKQAYQNQCNS
jgi:hypothetical protein